MVEKLAPLGHGEIDTLILQALVRKLVVKGVLSPDDVRARCSMPQRVSIWSAAN